MTRYKVYLNKSSRSEKKYSAEVIGDGKRRTIHFGASGYEDYTMHHDENRKQNYLRRHSHDHVDDIFSAGFWAMRLLWNKPTLVESAQDISDEFDVDIYFEFDPEY